VEIVVLAGLAQGQPIMGMDAIIESAKSEQRELARLSCVLGGEGR
jgi:hypothetical protein